MKEAKHIPVLLQESVESLQLHPGMVVVDATFGGGGHSEAILKAIGPKGKLIAFDRDQSALERYQDGKLIPENLLLVHANYSDIEKVLVGQGEETMDLSRLGLAKVDAVFADLGFSSDQIEAPERGLSFLHDGPLDMRLDQSEESTAERLVNHASLEELTQILRTYGEEPKAHHIAKLIVDRRVKAPFETTRDLSLYIEEHFPRKPYGKTIHPATKVFQALRMSVNQESEHLARFLERALSVLKPGGILSVISFHSGEDRQVKNFLQQAGAGCVCPKGFPVCLCGKKPQLVVLTKKPVRPSEAEVKQNPRSRSALLRVAQKI
jgi:16S rRNA (cytosine1402-N4)-methyltransferase